MSAKIVKINY